MFMYMRNLSAMHDGRVAMNARSLDAGDCLQRMRPTIMQACVGEIT